MSKKLTAEQKTARAAAAKATRIAKKAEAEARAKMTPVKRFVIAKNRIGKNQVLVFTNKEGIECIYNHDVVYNALKAKFESMPCFQKYKSYTNTNNLPLFVRELKTRV